MDSFDLIPDSCVFRHLVTLVDGRNASQKYSGDVQLPPNLVGVLKMSTTTERWDFILRVDHKRKRRVAFPLCSSIQTPTELMAETQTTPLHGRF